MTDQELIELADVCTTMPKSGETTHRPPTMAELIAASKVGQAAVKIVESGNLSRSVELHKARG